MWVAGAMQLAGRAQLQGDGPTHTHVNTYHQPAHPPPHFLLQSLSNNFGGGASFSSAFSAASSIAICLPKGFGG